MFILWRGFLYNQIEAILSQYEMEIYEVTKGRGTHICNTNKGMFVLTGFRGTKEKGELLREFLSRLEAAGFSVEQIEVNKSGEAVTIDELSEERYILKEYIGGVELNVNHEKELNEAAVLLARYHRISEEIQLNEMEYSLSSVEGVREEKERHYRELIKAKNYMRSRKKKNEFERVYLNHCDQMIQIAKESLLLLEKNDEVIKKETKYCICHGDYNQHNILSTDLGWRIINFENFERNWCVLDLANFLRKMQEKNDWEISIGSGILEAYEKERPLEEEEWEKLYALLLFPEKFWKVTNHYMNSRKSWISQRDIEKLKKVIEQEAKRQGFVENLFAIPEE